MAEENMSEDLNNPLAGMFAMVDQEAGLEAAADEVNATEPTEEVSEQDDSNAQQVDNKGEASDTQADTVILTKDGQHTLPYSVVAKERAEKVAERAGREAAEAKAQELQSQLDAITASQNAVKADVDSREFDEKFAEAKEVFPELVEEMLAQKKELSTVPQLKAALDQLFKERDARLEEESATAIKNEQAEAEKALNSNEKLIFMRDNRPDLWEEAKRLDNTLINLPEYQGISKAERFNDVARLIEMKHGEVIKSSQETTNAQTPRAVVKKQTGPNSLSDMPSGNYPTERVTFENADASQTRQMTKGLTSDQIMAQINAS
jgi:hypothetical protein